MSRASSIKSQQIRKEDLDAAIESTLHDFRTHGIDISNHLKRLKFELDAIAHFNCARSTVVELGGGYTPLPIALSKIYTEVIVVDDFKDWDSDVWTDTVVDIASQKNVRFVDGDLGQAPVLSLEGIKPDIVISFNCFEHLHGSPKKLLESLECDEKEQAFFIAMPKSQNLKKRIDGLLGRNDWSDFNDWWSHEIFRGHVREPSTTDMLQIAERSGGTDISLKGKNFIGYYRHNRGIRLITRILDPLILRHTPSLCSDLYVSWQSTQK